MAEPPLMDDKEFNLIINGPLWHPLWPLHVNRLVLALRGVLDAGGLESELALREIAAHYDEKDRSDARG